MGFDCPNIVSEYNEAGWSSAQNKHTKTLQDRLQARHCRYERTPSAACSARSTSNHHGRSPFPNLQGERIQSRHPFVCESQHGLMQMVCLFLIFFFFSFLFFYLFCFWCLRPIHSDRGIEYTCNAPWFQGVLPKTPVPWTTDLSGRQTRRSTCVRSATLHKTSQ